jgi:N6-L-threonylcarbamoyladenine synthase
VTSAADPLVLGIETSCDETAAAVVRGGHILSTVVASQDEVHGRYGGVVPELASRHHLLNIVPVVEGALTRAGVQPSDLDALAVTRGPGLVGALLVGVQMAKAMAFAWKKPLVGVNHLEGHLFAAHLSRSVESSGTTAASSLPEYPYVALLASGGHTALYDVARFGEYRTLGQTRDDAAGEAFDKVAKLLGLGYPGGAKVEKLARSGDASRVPFPRVMPGQSTFDLSFSGLKTAVAQRIRELGPGLTPGSPTGNAEGEGERAREQLRADLCAAFQAAVIEVLERRAEQALQHTGRRRLVVAGGVAANSALRESLRAAVTRLGGELFVPPRDLCTDNAAMIAGAGALRVAGGERDSLRLNAVADLAL